MKSSDPVKLNNFRKILWKITLKKFYLVTCPTESTYNYIKSLNIPSVNTIIGNRQIYASSMGEGKTAIEKQRKGTAVDEIKKLSEQILSELN